MLFVSLTKIRGALFLIALVFLSANMATNEHAVHTGLAKLITVDHQVRRERSRAERETLKTSVLPGKEENSVHPLQAAAGTSWAQNISVNCFLTLHSPSPLQHENFSLNSSPVLNL